MTHKEEKVVFDLLEILADCELAKMKMVKDNVQNAMAAEPVMTADKKKGLQETLNGVINIGNLLFTLKAKLNKIRGKGKIITPN